MSRKILKWIGIVLGGLIGLLIVAFVVLMITGGARANNHDIPLKPSLSPRTQKLFNAESI
ncbi:MAG: hypothetical protein IPL78_02895 [Chloroflexi bacterium]|nr:hypothetical protein [Chloroflexota bacterium]